VRAEVRVSVCRARQSCVELIRSTVMAGIGLPRVAGKMGIREKRAGFALSKTSQF